MLLHKHRRNGKMNILWTFILASAAIVTVLVGMLVFGRPEAGVPADKLVIYCAAGVLPPLERIAAEYETEYQTEIEIKFGGSGSLLAQIEVDKFSEADLYIAGDDYYTELACQKGLAAETLPVAHMSPVVAVRIGELKSGRGSTSPTPAVKALAPMPRLAKPSHISARSRPS